MSWLKIILIAIPVLTIVVYFGLPRALNMMGLHPHYDIPEYDLAGKRALIIATSQDTLGDTGKETGVFGSELTVPYYAFLDAGMEVDLVSIKGGEIPVEPRSMGWPLGTEADFRFKKDTVAMAKLTNSISVKDVDITKYDAIFLAGGWGAAYDFAQSEDLAALVTAANAGGDVIGSVCHGALGLVNAKNTDGTPLIEGRTVTGVTDTQINQLGISITPKHPETELRAAKANFEADTAFRDMFANHVRVDGSLVTGQNQNSGAEAAHRMMELLSK